jgi:hypothetical protein
MAGEPANPIKIFISYAQEDRYYLDRLIVHLATLKRLGWVSIWSDREITPGDDWEHEIDSHLDTADIIVLLVSAAFMASDYAYGVEMMRALERASRGEVEIIPIIIRPVSWQGAPFGKLQALPEDAKPISTWRNSDAAFSDVVQGIQEVVSRLLTRKTEETQTASLLLQEKIAAGNFDVFLCHNDKDKPEVKKIAELLKKRGILPWLDEWEARPGFPWQRLLEEQIEQIKSAVVFVGKDGVGPWQQLEIEALLREFANRGCPVIPVLLENASAEPKLPLFLRGMTWVDFRKHEPVPLKQLIWGITGKRD